MPRKTKPTLAVVPTPAEELAKAIPEALALSEKRLTRRTLPRFLEQVLLAYSPAQLSAAMTTLWRLAKDGDLQAARTILEMHNLLQSKGGFSIVNNIQNNTIAATNGNGYDRTFDAIARRLDDNRRRLNPAIDVEAQ